LKQRSADESKKEGETMRRIVLKASALLACFCLLFFLAAGCSQNSDGEDGEKGGVEKLTDRAAATAVKKIRTPLDKARTAADLGEERAEEMDRAVRQQ
jgi:hypothetical protein